MKEYKMKTRKYMRLAIFLVILLSACGGNEPNIEAQLQGKTLVKQLTHNNYKNKLYR